MSTNKPNKEPVFDVAGHKYELVEELSRGGQGIVYKTNHQNILLKGFIHNKKNEDEREKAEKWEQHIQWLINQDLNNLQLARPLILANKRKAYFMKLMDGLIPLDSLLKSFIDAADKYEHIEDYLNKGGLKKRIRILFQLARTLNQIHSRGMLYGDLSLNNIFVSEDIDQAETWLIDCDNISYESYPGVTVYSPDYGAPELVRGEAMLSSMTDCWSFAVIAYQLLTHNHPFKGEYVQDSAPDVEEQALRGSIPWINDSSSRINECFVNLPLQIVEESCLPELFKRCFEDGRVDPTKRPSIAEWLSALAEVDESLVQCRACDSHFIYCDKNQYQCFFCDVILSSDLVHFEEFIYQPILNKKEANNLMHLLLDDGAELNFDIYPTNRKVTLQLGNKQELKRLMPTFSQDMDFINDNIAVEYGAEGLLIDILKENSLHLQRGNKLKLLQKKQRIQEKFRSEEPFYLHVGDINNMHIVWKFGW